MAGARHKRQPRPDRFGTRRTNVRRPLPRMIIVTDDSENAPRYFACLHRHVSSHVVIKAVPVGKGPDHVLLEARAQQEQLSDEQGASDDTQDMVWMLLDMEHTEDRREAANRVAEIGRAKGIKVALSDPCFELWILLHLVNTGRMFNTCKDVWHDLQKQWEAKFKSRPDSKASLDYQRIIGDRGTAAKRAEQQHKSGGRSYTEIYRLIGEIERLCRLPPDTTDTPT